MEEWVTSVGIDVGTSTTKWILSRLRLTGTASGLAWEQYEITGRRIEYESPIFDTPLAGENEIDAAALVSLLQSEYVRAGLTPQQVQTGALIMTGETAVKTNAEMLAYALAGQAGGLVAAAAGSDLESRLAGIGSGAARYSEETGKTVANVDIGGGTANAAYFHRGMLVATFTLHIGGRLLRLCSDGDVRYAAPALRSWAAKNPSVRLPGEGGCATLNELEALTRIMAETLLRCVSGCPDALREAEELIVGGPQARLLQLPLPDEIWVSGGVGSLMREPPPASLADAARYGDIGPLLAAALAEATCSVPVRAAPQSSRATVIGAGAWTMEISGSTLFYSPSVLPLRNVPVAVAWLPAEAGAAEEDAASLRTAIAEALQRGVSLYGAAGGDPPFALGIRTEAYTSYKRLQRLASAIAAAWAELPTAAGSTLLAVCQKDMAQALGHALLTRMGGPEFCRLVCLDRLSPEEGQYLDVGLPIKEDIVPVVIKSLAFGG